ncbi:MAG: formylglycine-generating enzyme family protein [Planctomycetota bacterium]|nr:formylglycine-generating enzyme family protein [Planctomycetota bacterium]
MKQPTLGDTFTNSMGMTLAYIPPGEFVMGSPPTEDGRAEHETQHKVTLTQGFYIGIHTVTQAQWKAVMGDSASRFKGDDLPVDEVVWDDAATFCKRLGQKEGKPYRLPTEAEWEYACRAGTTTVYSTGQSEAGLGEAAWYGGNSESNATHPGGLKKPNAWGLYDMLGNVWEWCNDGYGEYPSGAVTDPAGADDSRRVLRGGDWRCGPLFCRAAHRFGSAPTYRGDVFRGFRVALSAGVD